MNYPNQDSQIAPVCPFANAITESVLGYEQDLPPEGAVAPEQLRSHMLDWYRTSGFRGCLFNKIAAREAQDGRFDWLVPVEYGPGYNLSMSADGARVVRNFESIIADGNSEGLVSYMFPGITTPRQLGDLLKSLAASNPDRFRILDVVDRQRLEGFGNEEFVGIQFRIKVGYTDEGEEAFAYPMIYNPWAFTTFARRYDVPTITFNRYNSKQNPETRDSFIGVDDVDLSNSLSPQGFARMYQRSLDVSSQAHSGSGARGDQLHYDRKLYRAHNALVLPASAWEN